eukprot:1529472-Rhodomonas_salina.1
MDLVAGLAVAHRLLSRAAGTVQVTLVELARSPSARFGDLRAGVAVIQEDRAMTLHYPLSRLSRILLISRISLVSLTSRSLHPFLRPQIALAAGSRATLWRGMGSASPPSSAFAMRCPAHGVRPEESPQRR